jgi:hypothetical protein
MIGAAVINADAISGSTTATVENEGTRTPKWQIVTPPASNSDCSDELQSTVVARRPPFNPCGARAAMDRLDHPKHRRREIVGRRDREHDVVLEYVGLVVNVANRKFDDVRN